MAIIEALVICTLLSFCIASLGIVIATFYESFESFSVIMNFIVMPMFFLSGAMYPVKMLPPILQLLTRINPFTYGIDALKHAIFREEGVFDFPLLMDLGVLVATSVVFVVVAGSLFEKRK
jgi:ABC-2 type transport system permease protein